MRRSAEREHFSRSRSRTLAPVILSHLGLALTVLYGCWPSLTVLPSFSQAVRPCRVTTHSLAYTPSPAPRAEFELRRLHIDSCTVRLTFDEAQCWSIWRVNSLELEEVPGQHVEGVALVLADTGGQGQGAIPPGQLRLLPPLLLPLQPQEGRQGGGHPVRGGPQLAALRQVVGGIPVGCAACSLGCIARQ